MMPKAQTKATDKWQKKVGIISKSFKLKKELTDEFKEACEKAGVSQASQISKMMREFIDEQK
jgi:hypothetical protein